MEDVLKMYVDVAEEFKREHPLFIGAKYIHSVPKNLPPKEIEKYLEIFRGLHEKFPQFVVGFDFVGQEVM